MKREIIVRAVSEAAQVGDFVVFTDPNPGHGITKDCIYGPITEHPDDSAYQVVGDGGEAKDVWSSAGNRTPTNTCIYYPVAVIQYEALAKELAKRSNSELQHGKGSGYPRPQTFHLYLDSDRPGAIKHGFATAESIRGLLSKHKDLQEDHIVQSALDMEDAQLDLHVAFKDICSFVEEQSERDLLPNKTIMVEKLSTPNHQNIKVTLAIESEEMELTDKEKRALRKHFSLGEAYGSSLGGSELAVSEESKGHIRFDQHQGIVDPLYLEHPVHEVVRHVRLEQPTWPHDAIEHVGPAKLYDPATNEEIKFEGFKLPKQQQATDRAAFDKDKDTSASLPHTGTETKPEKYHYMHHTVGSVTIKNVPFRDASVFDTVSHPYMDEATKRNVDAIIAHCKERGFVEWEFGEGIRYLHQRGMNIFVSSPTRFEDIVRNDRHLLSVPFDLKGKGLKKDPYISGLVKDCFAYMELYNVVSVAFPNALTHLAVLQAAQMQLHKNDVGTKE
jgi:hypothetical protein